MLLLSLLLPIEFELCCDVEDDDDGAGPNDGEDGGDSVSLDGPSNSSY